MSITTKKLGEAELEIMQVIWGSEPPVTSNYILKELRGRRSWQLSTLMTSLARLADKGFVTCDRSTGITATHMRIFKAVCYSNTGRTSDRLRRNTRIFKTWYCRYTA